MSADNPQWPKEHIWQYKTANHSAWNLTRPFLHALTSERSDGKISYWFDWNVEDLPEGFGGLFLKGDPTAPEIYSKLDELRMHFGSWKNAYVIEPQDSEMKEWQFGFLIPGKKQHMSVCSLILEGKVKILRGPSNFTVYGLDLKHQETPLKISGMCKRDFLELPII